MPVGNNDFFVFAGYISLHFKPVLYRQFFVSDATMDDIKHHDSKESLWH